MTFIAFCGCRNRAHNSESLYKAAPPAEDDMMLWTLSSSLACNAASAFRSREVGIISENAEIGVAAKLGRAVEHARLSAHE
jgi:hypothetical protein